MEFFADLLIAAGAIGLAAFCFVLSRRLKALSRLDSGIGGAISVLAQQVDVLTRALKAAQATARDSAGKLESQTRRADAACRQLELLMASLHDLPPAQPAQGRPHTEIARQTEAAPAPSRPLARWNTNRLNAEPDPVQEAQPQEEPTPLPRARTFAPELPAKVPSKGTPKRSRSRVVRRRQTIGAQA